MSQSVIELSRKQKNHWLQVSASKLPEINQVTPKCQIDFLEKT